MPIWLSRSWHITVVEQLSIFLQYAQRGLLNWVLQEQFQWSGDTITKYDLIMEYITYKTNAQIRCIHCVLDALTLYLVYCTYVWLPGDDVTIPDVIRCSLKLQFFINCIGALDGTHLPAHVSPDYHPRYQNRKGQISQNVLAMCNLEMNFLYLCLSWLGG
jgi:hypothetical protein